MWDEITLNVPATVDAWSQIERMQKAVQSATAQDTGQAEAEWQSATRKVGMSQFSAQPTVDLRPAAAGVGIVVRFVTRASERFETRKRVSDAMLGMMEGTERPLEMMPQ